MRLLLEDLAAARAARRIDEVGIRELERLCYVIVKHLA
jgi:DNA-binding GntR family transcriptional regulator